jgi:1-deoxy-D-xylulose-5-phosphate synthase
VSAADRLIDTLSLPDDLRTLDPASLRRVAEEVRAEIIETISLNGGHLGASLGVVELTIALHAELETPRDVIVWDVGHQCYAHKLLTGRLCDFRSIRTYGGLSGFPARCESEYDIYGTGHSSSSVSAALGILQGKRAQALLRSRQEDGRAKSDDPSAHAGKVVAVIGDGALTGGMAYEALNHAGHLHTPLLVVLNDNAMSIEKNVGAMSTYLSRIRTDPTLYRFRRDLERRLSRLPAIGEGLAAMGTQLKDSIKAAIVPGMLFEDLGFTYVGVIDGHDIEALRASIRRSLAIEGPVLLHCRTVKGKGYAPAEQEPDRYHGTPRFSVTTGESLDPEGPTTFTRAFGEAMVELATADPRVIGITAAMAAGTGLDLLKEAFPERFFDVGIAEGHAVGFAAGLAAAGMRPVVAVYSTFLQRAYDQVVQDVCLQRLPVVFAIDRAGLVGADGATHHGAFDLSFLRIIPNLMVFVPKDEAELQRLLATALSLDGPSVIRYPRSAGVGLPLESPIRPYSGPWVQELRTGGDVLLLATGPVVSLALDAAETLAAQGVAASVAAVPRVHPLDEAALLPLLERHSALVTVEDNVIAGGFGSAVLEVLAGAGVCMPVKRAGLPDEFVGHGPVVVLRRDVRLTAEALAGYAVELLGQSGDRAG